MLAGVLEKQETICAVLAEDRKDWHLMPFDIEFTVPEPVASDLKPLHVFSDALVGEKHITISAIRPFLRHIVEQVVLVDADDCATHLVPPP